MLQGLVMQRKLDWLASGNRILEDVFCRMWLCRCGWTALLRLCLRLPLRLRLRLRLRPRLRLRFDPQNHEILGTDQNTKA